MDKDWLTHNIKRTTRSKVNIKANKTCSVYNILHFNCLCV